ncbi:MAG: O-antigen ligase family protein [Roseburia sp.]
MKKEKYEKVSDFFAGLQDKIVILYTFSIFFLFPLYTHNAYYDISISKYRFMVNATIGFGVCYLICYLLKFKKQELSHWKWWDLLYVLFLIFGGVSVACSEYGQEAFTGEMGRRNGLFIYLIYALVLLMVVSNEKVHKFSLYFLEASGIVAGSIGILNHYGLDPLHFLWDLAEVQKDYFTSTFGHIDTFGTYVGMLFVLSSVLFLKCDAVWEGIFHAITAIISLFAILTNSTDGSFLAIFLFLGAGWLFIQKKSEALRYFLVVMLFGLEAGLAGILNQRTAGTKLVNGFCLWFTTTKLSWIIGGIAAVLCGLLAFATYRKWKLEKAGKVLKWILLFGFIVGILGILVFFILANYYPAILEKWFGKTQEEEILLEIFQITETWGNNRGYIWIKTWDYFQELPLFGKLFGTGPDTSYQIFQQICTESFLTDYNLYFDNAHNEYLQMLLTHGILGTASYFGWIGCSIIQCFQNAKKSVIFYGIGFAILAYMGMAAIGINNISVMGIVFLLICLGKGRCQTYCEKVK